MTTAPRPPSTMLVGDYTLITRLGEGGMGVVHLARKGDGERIALKVLRPHIVGDDEARARLAREVSSLSRIKSRWVAEIVDADPWGPIPYVATRYVPGYSLHELVAEEGPIAGTDLLWLARCLAEGIASVHAAGVLHRDVKPSNVLMEGRTPILIDFGLARVADDPKLTHTGWLLGTPGYLPPEILYGDNATPASDVHSWAATVAFAGLGRPPFGTGPGMAIMDRVRRGEHDLTGLPPRLAALLNDALDPDPVRRPTLNQIREELNPDVEFTQRIEVEPEDLFTLPLAIAAQAGYVDPVSTPDATWVMPEDQPVQLTKPHRLRSGLLAVGLGSIVAAGVAAYPYLASIALLLLVILFRSGSLLASATGDRQRLRGARWYDLILAPLSAPWHLVRSLPGTFMLCFWAAGLAVAGALICYAASLTMSITLAVSGGLLAIGLWFGPGGSRVRGPVRRLTDPLSRKPRDWLVALVVVLTAACAVGLLAEAGTDWSPVGRPSVGRR